MSDRLPGGWEGVGQHSILPEPVPLAGIRFSALHALAQTHRKSPPLPALCAREAGPPTRRRHFQENAARTGSSDQDGGIGHFSVHLCNPPQVAQHADSGVDPQVQLRARRSPYGESKSGIRLTRHGCASAPDPPAISSFKAPTAKECDGGMARSSPSGNSRAAPTGAWLSIAIGTFLCPHGSLSTTKRSRYSARGGGGAVCRLLTALRRR